MEKKIIGYIVLLVVALVVAVALLWHVDQQSAPKREAHAQLAQCLEERGVKFYGAYWCPACAQQKAMFEGSVKKLPYIECSLPDRSRNELCQEEEIDGYPLWEFDRNGEKYRCGGVVSVEILAHLSGCPSPSYKGKEIVTNPSELYEQMVVQPTMDNLKKRGVSGEDIQEVLDSTKETIERYLNEQHEGGEEITIRTASDTKVLLDAIAEAAHSCRPYTKPEPEADMPTEIDLGGIEIEAQPVELEGEEESAE